MAAKENGKRKNVPPIVENAVANLLTENRAYTGAELKKRVEGALKARGFRFDFTARTYQNIKNRIGEPLAHLDQKWSMSAFPVGPSALECVLEIQKWFLDNGCFLTARRTKWIEHLCPVLGHDKAHLAQVAAFYSRVEQISEVSGSDDSQVNARQRELDKTYLVNRDESFPTVVRDWSDFYLPGADTAPDVGGAGLLQEFVTTLFENGAEAAIALAQEHPDVERPARECLVLLKRSDFET